MFTAVLKHNLNRPTCTAQSRWYQWPLAPGAPQPGRQRRPWLGQATAHSPSTRKLKSRGFCLDSPRSWLFLILSEMLPEPFMVASLW